MTAIVGIISNNGKVHIAGDGASVSGMFATYRKDRKVFRNGKYVMGFTTSYRMGQILQYHFKPPTPNAEDKKDLFKFMVCKFVPKVRKSLEENHWLLTDKGRDEAGAWLVGIQGRLFEIDSDLQVVEPEHFAAIGCGREIAMGALFAYLSAGNGICGKLPQGGSLEALRTALFASAKYSTCVYEPFHFVSEK